MSEIGAEVTPFATQEELEDYIGATRAAELPSDEEVTRLIQRASELIQTSSNYLASRAKEGLLYIDSYGGYVDPLSTLWSLTTDDYAAALRLATCAQVEFWLEWGEDHGIVGLQGSAQTGKVMVSRLPVQLAPRARGHLGQVGLLSSKVAIR